jgi:hypothetical protein
MESHYSRPSPMCGDAPGSLALAWSFRQACLKRRGWMLRVRTMRHDTSQRQWKSRMAEGTCHTLVLQRRKEIEA